MADLGFLNFGVGVDGEDLLAKALEKDKQEALEVQKILASLKVPGVEFKVSDAAINKSQQAADKAALSSVKLGEAREKAAASSLLGEQKLQTELERTTAIQNKSAAEIASIEKQAANMAALNQKKIASESERAAAIRSAASKKAMSDEAKIMAMIKENEAKQLLWQQRQLTEIERTNAARSRAQIAAVKGQKNLNNAVGLTNKTMFSQRQLLQQISNQMGIYLSIYSLQRFIGQLATVRGEFEMQQISLKAILKDGDAAVKVFNQIKDLSVVSPFQFGDLVSYAKQLSAFSIPVNELYDTTKRLSDISAGLGVDMGRIILAYGQVRSASVLRGQELRQFTEAGIPLVDELAEKFGKLEGRVVSAGEVFDKISNRLVPFKMVKDIFADLTDEGGKFYMMQEKQSESLKGQISNLTDAFQIMLNEIGKANDGILKDGVSGIRVLMENWKAVSKALLSLITTYGTYRAILIATSAIQKMSITMGQIQMVYSLSSAITGATKAQLAFNAVASINPWLIAAAGVVALVGGLILFRKEAETTEKKIEKLQSSIDSLEKSGERENKLIDKYKELKESIAELNRELDYLSSKKNKSNTESERVVSLSKRMKDENEKLRIVMNELAKAVPGAATAFDEYGNALEINTQKVIAYTDAEKKARIEVLAKEKENADESIRIQKRRIKEITDILLAGKETTYTESNSVYGNIPVSITNDLTLPRKNALLKELDELREGMISLEKKSTEAANAISGIKHTPDIEKLESGIVEINKRILSMTGFDAKFLSDKTIKDNTKDIATIKEEAINAYEEAKKKIELIASMPYAFTAFQKEDAEKALKFSKEYVDILGGVNDSKKNPRITQLEDEISLIKKAEKYYKDLQKYQSESQAKETANIVYGVDFSVSSPNEQMMSKISELQKIDKEAGEKARKSFDEGVRADKGNTMLDVLKNNISELEKYISSYKDSYDFYEKLLGAGEDKQTAIKIAFGVEFTGSEVYLGKKLSEIVKDASRKVGLVVDFDIDEGNIIDQIGEAYKTLTPELKKQIDALEKYRKDKQENTYLEYLSFIQKEVPEGTGVAFDLSSVLAKMKNEVNKIQNEAAELLISPDPLIDKSAINKTKELQIKSANDVAANNAKNIGSNFVEQSLKNKMLWENFKNMSEASYGDIKRMIEEVGELQEKTLSKEGISKIFSTSGYTGKKASKEDDSAFSPILDLLGNSKDVDELNATVISLLENINANKEEGAAIDERIAGLNNGQIASLRIVLTLIRQMSAALNGVKFDLEESKLKRTTDGFKKLSNAATNVADNVEGLSDAFGTEFDDITKGSLDLVKTIASSTMDVVDSITSFVDDSGKAMSLSAIMASEEVTKVEKASVILTIISAALQVAMKIASIFTRNKTKKTDDAIKDHQRQLDDLQRSYEQTEKAAEKFYTLDADASSVSKWLTAEKTAIKSRYGYLAKFGESGKKYLVSLYEEAERKATSLAGSSYLKMEEANIRQQKRALEAQIKAAEGDNKKGKRNDEIDGYRDQLKDLDEKLAETRDKWYETLRGFSMQDIADDFADAWVEAFEKGEDSIDALNKKFDELIKNMIIKQASMRIVSKIMQPMLDMIDKAIGEDGILTESEISGIMGALPDTLKKLDDGMNSIIKPLLDKLGITFGSSAEAGEGLSKGIAGVTEDTANLLASYLNAMRADLSNQKIYLQKIIDAIIPISNQFALQVAELKKIEANTHRTANNTEKNVEVLNEVKAILKSITTQGSGKKVNI